jgi:hypothetical protein
MKMARLLDQSAAAERLPENPSICSSTILQANRRPKCKVFDTPVLKERAGVAQKLP